MVKMKKKVRLYYLKIWLFCNKNFFKVDTLGIFTLDYNKCIYTFIFIRKVTQILFGDTTTSSKLNLVARSRRGNMVMLLKCFIVIKNNMNFFVYWNPMPKTTKQCSLVFLQFRIWFFYLAIRFSVAYFAAKKDQIIHFVQNQMVKI